MHHQLYKLSLQQLLLHSSEGKAAKAAAPQAASCYLSMTSSQKLKQKVEQLPKKRNLPGLVCQHGTQLEAAVENGAAAEEAEHHPDHVCQHSSQSEAGIQSAAAKEEEGLPGHASRHCSQSEAGIESAAAKEEEHLPGHASRHCSQSEGGIESAAAKEEEHLPEHVSQHCSQSEAEAGYASKGATKEGYRWLSVALIKQQSKLVCEDQAKTSAQR